MAKDRSRRYPRPYGIRSFKHDNLTALLLTGLRNGGKLTRQDFAPYNNPHLLERLKETGLVHRVAQGVYEVDIQQLQQCSYVIPDDLYERLADPAYQYQLRGTREYHTSCYQEDAIKARPAMRANRQTDTREIALRDVLFQEVPDEDSTI